MVCISVKNILKQGKYFQIYERTEIVQRKESVIAANLRNESPASISPKTDYIYKWKGMGWEGMGGWVVVVFWRHF